MKSKCTVVPRQKYNKECLDNISEWNGGWITGNPQSQVECRVDNLNL